MKRFALLLVTLITLLAASVPARAQASTPAAAIAARDEAEERNKRLNMAVEDLQAAQVTLQKRLSALAEELGRLRDEAAKSSTAYASREDIKKLAEKIVELDEQRKADKKLIMDEFAKIVASIKTLSTTPPPPRPAPPKPATPEKGYEHVVQAGDTLSSIAKAFRENGIKVSTQQIQDANPGLNPNALKTGQKIFIPQPK